MQTTHHQYYNFTSCLQIFGEKVDVADPILDKIIEFNEIAVEAATIGKEDIDVWTWTKRFNPNYALSVTAKEVFDRNIKPLYQKYKVRAHCRRSLFIVL